MGFFRKDISTYPDEALVQLLGSGRSNEALTELHARYAQKVLGFFLRMFQGDADKAQDFVQDLFLRILDKHNQFNPDKKFYTWMFTIASNMGKTSFRDQRTVSISHDTYELNHLAEWTDSGIDRTAFRNALKMAIHTLRESHREAFTLRYMQEMSIKEIAEICGVSEGTIKSRLFYATKKVAEQLEEFNPNSEGMIFKLN